MLKATAHIAESIPRAGQLASQSLLASGRPSGVALYLRRGEVVTGIEFCSGSTAGATLNNIWYALTDASFNRVGITADDVASGWPALTRKPLVLTTPYTVPSDGFYYPVVVVNGTTMPTIAGASNIAPLMALAPVASWSDTGHGTLTNPASAPNPFTNSLSPAIMPWAAVY